MKLFTKYLGNKIYHRGCFYSKPMGGYTLCHTRGLGALLELVKKRFTDIFQNSRDISLVKTFLNFLRRFFSVLHVCGCVRHKLYNVYPSFIKIRPPKNCLVCNENMEKEQRLMILSDVISARRKH